MHTYAPEMILVLSIRPLYFACLWASNTCAFFPWSASQLSDPRITAEPNIPLHIIHVSYQIDLINKNKKISVKMRCFRSTRKMYNSRLYFVVFTWAEIDNVDFIEHFYLWVIQRQRQPKYGVGRRCFIMFIWKGITLQCHGIFYTLNWLNAHCCEHASHIKRSK